MRYLIILASIILAPNTVLAQAQVKYLIESGYAGQELTPASVDRRDLLDAKRLARLGSRQAQFTTGAMYHALGDKNSAVYWYRRAALFRHPLAAHNLATMFYTGDGVEQDMEAAERWFLVAAEQGYPQAQTQLGIMTYRGEIESPDKTEAEWYRDAALGGDAFAQFNLGVLLFNGAGVEQDSVKALAWLKLANRELNVEESVQKVIATVSEEQLEEVSQVMAQLEQSISPPVFRG